MHSGDNKEAFPYAAIKSNDIMDFLGNSKVYYISLCSIINIWVTSAPLLIKVVYGCPSLKLKLIIDRTALNLVSWRPFWNLSTYRINFEKFGLLNFFSKCCAIPFHKNVKYAKLFLGFTSIQTAFRRSCCCCPERLEFLKSSISSRFFDRTSFYYILGKLKDLDYSIFSVHE